MNMEQVLPLIETLSESKGVEDIEAVCLRFCELCDLEYYLFGVCNATSLSSPQIFTISNYPSEWYDGYFESDLQKSDPVVRYCFDNTVPITWNKLTTLDDYCDPGGLEFMSKAKANGLVDGLSVPVKAPSGENSIFSLSSSKEENIERRLLEVLPFAQYFGYSIFETYLKLNIGQSPLEKLTPREKESLFWACEGKTAWEMSQIMSLTERTAIYHLSSATKKLGAANRQHAVAKAIMCGLIKAVP